MRRLLIAAAAAAPLALAAGQALAQTTVSNGRTTPISTSSSGDVDVASGGSITLSGAGPAITLDSNNNVTIEGSVVNKNADNAVGVLIRGGNTGSLTNTGAITVSEDYTASDSVNTDGIVEAPFATGTGKIGVQVVGTAPFTGALNLGGAGITVKGNNSYGVSVEGPVIGSITSTGPINVTGDNTVGVRTIASITGGLTLGSTVSVQGAGARGVDVEAPISNGVRIYGAVTTTGYSLTTRSTTNLTLSKIQTTPLDVQQGGATVTIGSDLAQGFYIAGAPAGTATGSLADVDGDGVADGVEGTGALTSFGSAPGLLIGAAGKTINLGAFSTGDNAYGVLLRGSITADGVYDGVASTAVQIGSGGAVNITGGIRNVGTISADSFEANATAVHILSGSNIPTLRNDGGIAAAVSDSGLTTGLGGASGLGVVIDAGATLSSLQNNGTIIVTTVGNTGLVGGVVDASGTLSSVVNQGVISASRSITDATSTVTGAAVALDLSKNTSGVTLVQQLNPNPSVTFGTTSGTTDTSTTTSTATTPQIVGDVLLGSGPNSVSLLAGVLFGALDLGGAPSSLTIDGGGAFFGSLRYSGQALAVSVVNGTLTQTTPSTLKLSTLNLGATGVLNLAVDPVNNRSSLFQVGGAATIANGAKIGVNLVSAVSATQTFTLISSPQLSVASSDANLLASSSFLVNAAIHTNLTAGTVSVTLTPKSAADLGLSVGEGSALTPVVAGAANDSAVSAALLSSQDAATFSKLYRQLLPEHGDGVFLAVDQATRAIADLSTNHNDLFRPGSQEGGIWLQQFIFGLRQDQDVGAGSNVGGFGLVGGLETSDSNIGAFGLTVAYANASSDDPDLTGDGSTSFSQAEAGLNWKTNIGGLELAARGGGGYLWGVTRRQFRADASSFSAAVSRESKGTWNAWTADARASAAYRWNLGKRFFLQPQVKVDYVRLDQDGYLERFGGNGLNLNVGSRDADEASGSASVLFGAKFGATGAIRPTLELGVRDVFEGDAGAVTAAFASGGSTFTLPSTPITGAGGLARFGIKYVGPYVDLEVAAKAEAYKTYQEGDVRVSVSTRF